jgi:hypothetical protein
VNQLVGVSYCDGEYGKAVFEVEVAAEVENPDGVALIGVASVVVCCDCGMGNDCSHELAMSVMLTFMGELTVDAGCMSNGAEGGSKLPKSDDCQVT